MLITNCDFIGTFLLQVVVFLLIFTTQRLQKLIILMPVWCQYFRYMQPSH